MKFTTKNKSVKLKSGKAPVKRSTKRPARSKRESGPTLNEVLKDFIGVIDDMPADLARNHDYYSHGAPRQ